MIKRLLDAGAEMIYTLLSEFRLPWPPSCCLYQPTPFVGSSSRIASPALFYYFANPPILPSLLSLLSRALAVYTKKSASRTRALVRPTRGQGQSQGRGQRKGKGQRKGRERLSRVKLSSMYSKNFFWPENGPFIGQENLCMTSIKPVYVVHQTCVRGYFFRLKLQQESSR